MPIKTVSEKIPIVCGDVLSSLRISRTDRIVKGVGYVTDVLSVDWVGDVVWTSGAALAKVRYRVEASDPSDWHAEEGGMPVTGFHIGGPLSECRDRLVLFAGDGKRVDDSWVYSGCGCVASVGDSLRVWTVEATRLKRVEGSRFVYAAVCCHECPGMAGRS
ncbi:hypothetical protein ToRV1_ORF30L [tortoise ranavirus 1]|uniref:Uncharacterized protein n=1 Tax=Tortoise ranavirus TaxID=1585660 RepID=A0A0D3R3K6_9VIRU|nr:hypothetical protein ToRV1_ORF30L [tortoise ranavirus 1]